MSNRATHTSKEDRTVSSLVDMIKHGELRLPEMQRGYVWTATQVRNLIDSLYRGYPSGAILMWEAEEQDATRNLQIAQSASAFKTTKLLLDGQQRLTSLSAVLRGEPIKVRNRTKTIEIAFNLEHPDNLVEAENADDETENDSMQEDLADGVVQSRVKNLAFAVASPSILSQPNWVPVSRVMSGSVTPWSLIKHLVSDPDDPKATKYSDRIQSLKAIADYSYVVQVLGRKLSYEEVTEIFVRVNSAGAKLRGSDLALAQITSKWPGSLHLFEDFVDDVEKTSKWQIDTGILVRTLVAFATGQSRFKTVNSITRPRLEEAWKQAKAGLEGALNFLRTNAGFEDASLLASRFYLIPIAIYFVRNNGLLSLQDTKDMLKWIFTSSIRGWYSSSSETKLDADLAQLRSGATFAQLANDLERTYGLVHITAGDLVDRGQKSPLFAFSYLACKYHGALDWQTGAGLSLRHQGHAASIEFHHIFPKSLLQKGSYTKAEINQIANMAFLSSRANKSISNKPADIYLNAVVEKRGTEALLKQGIPASHLLWSDYHKFLRKRRKRLASMINRFIEAAINEGQVTQIKLGKVPSKRA